ncbi:FAD-binding protein [Saccharomonospora sp. NPDC006951]
MRQWTWDCDVLVIGSGGGALTGAFTAARAGLSVVVAEATDLVGGTTAYSGGGMWFPCNAVLRRAGDDDTIEAARTYYRAVVGDRTPRPLQDAFLDNGAALVDHLESDEALAFRVLPWPDYYGSAPMARAGGRHIIPEPVGAAGLGAMRELIRRPLPVERRGEPLPSTLSGGQALIGRLLLALSRRRNVTMRTGFRCDELIVEKGAVVGAAGTREGVRETVRARRGVLIAAGGFERDPALRERFGVPGRAADSMGAPGNTGAMLEAALAIGAATDLTEQAWWAPGITHPDGTSTFSLWFTGGIFVGDDGNRFTNESWPYDRIGRDIIRDLAAGTLRLPFWLVYDDRDGEVPPVHSTSVPMVDSRHYVEAGLRHSADSLAGLASLIGVPPRNLERTVARFNTMAASGKDLDFGRGTEPYDNAFAGDGSPLVPIERAPFHASAFGLSDLGTKGGLRTDESARVLGTEGAVIPGLYAAGNSMAAVSGETYPAGGNPIGSSMVFAFLAANDMARDPG